MASPTGPRPVHVASESASVGRNALALAVGQAVALAVNFAAWVHLSRVLGPEGFGVLTFGLALLSYALLAVSLGLDVVGVREIARAASGSADRIRALVSDVIGLRLSLAAAGAALYLLIAWTVADTTVGFATLGVLTIQLLARAVQVDWVYQGVERMGAVAGRMGGTSAIFAVLALALVHDGSDLVIAAVAVSVAPLVANSVLLAVYGREYGTPRPSSRSWGALLAPALPLAASAFVSEVYYNLDKVMLEALRTTAEVGLYGAGYKVYALAVAPAAALFPAFFPSLARAVTRSDRAEAARRMAGALLLLGMPVLAVAPFAAEPLVALLFGEDYAAAVPALELLLANAGVVYIAMAYGVPLTAWDHERAYFSIVAAGAALNVVLNVALILPFGTVGAAAATLATETAILIGMARLHRQATGTLHGTAWARALPPTVVVGISAWALCGRLPVAAWVPALIAVWALSAILTGGMADLRASFANRSTS